MPLSYIATSNCGLIMIHGVSTSVESDWIAHWVQNLQMPDQSCPPIYKAVIFSDGVKVEKKDKPPVLKPNTQAFIAFIEKYDLGVVTPLWSEPPRNAGHHTPGDCTQVWGWAPKKGNISPEILERYCVPGESRPGIWNYNPAKARQRLIEKKIKEAEQKMQAEAAAAPALPIEPATTQAPVKKRRVKRTPVVFRLYNEAPDIIGARVLPEGYPFSNLV